MIEKIKRDACGYQHGKCFEAAICICLGELDL